MIRFGAAATAILLTVSAASAAGKGGQTPSLLPGGDSRQPISIEADKLVYSDKEQKATYSGNVVVIQGDSKLTCSVMVVTLEKGGSAPSAPASGEGEAAASSGVRHMDCSGPVSMLSKEQTATADSAAYDKSQNKVWLIGHVALSNDGNVTKGDRLVYDLNSGQATVESAGGGKGARVSGQFLPGSASPAKDAPSPKATEAARKPKS